ncbi:conserved hypothetical protein [Culex quinquefasciatus]|uniref:START domain-containing protein n=1 Tax=Culex quinquefasciatus TaxID=7176 RepID=B0WQ84_CULQU|nr:conserved hypothetical protein [Culex quinquefasciatus]|eukprot:XP_001850868.1 conserved hypothetical protein [Culex quinquefasciatus]
MPRVSTRFTTGKGEATLQQVLPAVMYVQFVSPPVGVSCPPPLKPRDFVLQRSWLDTGPQGEQMLLSRSVPHKNFPPKKGYVRAMSYITGFVLQTNGNSKTGCLLKYVAHCDPQGTLPPWLVNKVTHTLGPRMVKDLKKAALGYVAWKQQQPHLRKPWRFPEEINGPRISIEDCMLRGDRMIAIIGEMIGISVECVERTKFSLAFALIAQNRKRNLAPKFSYSNCLDETTRPIPIPRLLPQTPTTSSSAPTANGRVATGKVTPRGAVTPVTPISQSPSVSSLNNTSASSPVVISASTSNINNKKEETKPERRWLPRREKSEAKLNLNGTSNGAVSKKEAKEAKKALKAASKDDSEVKEKKKDKEGGLKKRRSLLSLKF